MTSLHHVGSLTVTYPLHLFGIFKLSPMSPDWEVATGTTTCSCIFLNKFFGVGLWPQAPYHVRALKHPKETALQAGWSVYGLSEHIWRLCCAGHQDCWVLFVELTDKQWPRSSGCDGKWILRPLDHLYFLLHNLPIFLRWQKWFSQSVGPYLGEGLTL